MTKAGPARPAGIPKAPDASRRTWAAAALIACAGLVAYSNTFANPFQFDDVGQFIGKIDFQNPGALWAAISGNTRPFFFFTLALQGRLNGMEVWWYHAVNLAVHILSGLLLFGILRRTLASERLKGAYERDSLGLALAISLLWTVHPLQTESVTYIFQRAESMMGLFLLLTLYAFIRGCNGGRFWFAVSIFACVLGMATKEVMAVAPLVVLLYDRTFRAGAFVKALRGRWKYYAGLAGTWAVPVYLMATSYNFQLETGAGFGSTAMTPLQYARTEPGVILHYLLLSFRPFNLCFDYAWPVADTVGRIAPAALAVGALLFLTGWGLIRNHPLGFCAAWFFVILAPTSSIMPLPDPAVEHRMYLPLAGVLAFAVVGIYELVNRWMRQADFTDARRKRVRLAAGALCAMVVVMMGVLAYYRNTDYESAFSLWSDTVAKSPNCARARSNLGSALVAQGRYAEAIPQLKEALRLRPDMWPTHNPLGFALLNVNQPEEALFHFQELLKRRPDDGDALMNSANLLGQLGRHQEAIECFQKALRLGVEQPAYQRLVHYNLGVALCGLKRYDEAEQHLKEAVRLDPNFQPPREQLEQLEKLRREQ